MSKQEKRILALEVNPDCKALYVDYGDPLDPDGGMFCNKSGRYIRITEKDCKKCKSPVLAGITRAEAVERVAKVLCRYEDCLNDCTECAHAKRKNQCRYILAARNFLNIAEAALDALIGKEEARNANN